MSGSGGGSAKPDALHPQTCPICGRPSMRETHPFCSKRCAEVDLNRWLSGAYVIAGGRDDDAEESATPPGPEERGK